MKVTHACGYYSELVVKAGKKRPRSSTPPRYFQCRGADCGFRKSPLLAPFLWQADGVTTLLNVGGAVAGFLIGALSWVLFAFIGTPIRRFFDLRGEIVLAMNKYARNISEPPSNDFLPFVAAGQVANSRMESAIEFRRLGLSIFSLWENKTLARLILRLMGYRGDAAGRLLIELAEANTVTDRLGPRRSELARTLRLTP